MYSASSMVFFMVFIARNTEINVDTMRGKLILVWYKKCELCALE